MILKPTLSEVYDIRVSVASRATTSRRGSGTAPGPLANGWSYGLSDAGLLPAFGADMFRV